MIGYTVASFVFGLLLLAVIALSQHWWGWWPAIVITVVLGVGWGLWSARRFTRR